MIEQNKEFELQYWLKKDKAVVLNTYKRFFEIVPKELFKDCNVVADVGCGAYGGIFNEMQFPVMHGIDPMWTEFIDNKIAEKETCFTKYEGSSVDMIQGRYCCIFSINALDHSGDFQVSVKNIYNALGKGGLFALHIQLRKEKDFDEGHKMAIDIDIIKNAIMDMEEIFFQYFECCPFGNQKLTGKHIPAIIGVWKK